MSNNVLTSNFSDLSDKITAREPRLARSKCIIYLFAGFIWPDLSIWSFAIVQANFNSENKRTKSGSVWIWDWLRVLTKSFPPPLMNYKTSVLQLDIAQLGIDIIQYFEFFIRKISTIYIYHTVNCLRSFLLSIMSLPAFLSCRNQDPSITDDLSKSLTMAVFLRPRHNSSISSYWSELQCELIKEVRK